MKDEDVYLSMKCCRLFRAFCEWPSGDLLAASSSSRTRGAGPAPPLCGHSVISSMTNFVGHCKPGQPCQEEASRGNHLGLWQAGRSDKATPQMTTTCLLSAGPLFCLFAHSARTICCFLSTEDDDDDGDLEMFAPTFVLSLVRPAPLHNHRALPLQTCSGGQR